MGLVLEIGTRIKKFTIISIRSSYRSVCNHPFVVGTLCFLILMYRSCPFLFSLLISVSPVLVCTAILLGTLLSFGQPNNIPEIEEKETVSRDIASSLRAGVLGNSTVIAERDGNFTVEKFMENRGDNGIEKAIGQPPFFKDRKISRVEKDDSLVEHAPLVSENSWEFRFENGEIQEVMEKRACGLEQNLGTQGISDRYSLIHKDEDGILEVEDKIPKGNHLDLPPDDNREHGEDDDDDDDDESINSGSDRAESSSPDASMADIIPMLDELHPLLDSEATPQPANMPQDEDTEIGSDSHKSDDDDDEGEEEEEIQGNKEDDDSKSAIKWTEDDQKNLMDLGTLELERNQRLENLIARRRARNNWRMLAEKNLIDLESTDLPFNTLPPISTTRENPFDLPFDSDYNNTGLPPIPGSAPSILLPRRNPFDLPYDPSEEKPDLKGDDFDQEFITFNLKETPVFKRHESFSVGSSSLGFSRQERQYNKWRPYFVPERLGSEGTSYDLLLRQSSEVSDSRLSSVPDSESVCSVADQDEKKLDEQEQFDQEREVVPNQVLDCDLVGQGSESSSEEDVESLDIEKDEKRDVHHDVVEITLRDVESHRQTEPSLSEIGPFELNPSAIHPKTELTVKENSSNSISSVFAEVSKKVNASDVKREEPTNSNSSISRETSLNDFQIKDTVYDSSPPAEERSSFSSASSDQQIEISEICRPPSLHAVNEYKLEPRGVREIIYHGVTKVGSSRHDVKDVDGKTGSVVPEHVNDHVSVDPSSSKPDLGSIEKGVTKEQGLHNEKDKNNSSSSKAEVSVQVHQDEDKKLDSESEEKQSTTIVKNVSDESELSSEGDPVKVHGSNEGETVRVEQAYEIQSSSLSDKGSMNEGMVHKEEQKLPGGKDEVLAIHPECSTSKLENVEESSLKTDTIEAKTDSLTNLEAKVVLSGSNCEDVPSGEKSASELEKKLVSSSDKPMVEHANNHDKRQKPGIINPTDSGKEVSIAKNTSVPEVHDKSNSTGRDLKDDIVDRVDYDDHRLVSVQLGYLDEAYGSRVSEKINGNVVEIKDVDEGLLSELDKVGDFNVTKVYGESSRAEIIPKKTDIGSTNLELHTKDSNQVVQAKSFDDMINHALVQFRDVEVVLPSRVENPVSRNAGEPVKPGSDLQVVEARNVNDSLVKPAKSSDSKGGSVEIETSIALNKVPEKGVDDESTKSSDSKNRSVGVEANIALNQVSENSLVKSTKSSDSKDASVGIEASVPLSQVSESSLVKSTKSSDPNNELVGAEVSIALNESSESSVIKPSKSLDLKDGCSVGVEASVALNQISETSLSKSTQSSDSKDGSVGVEKRIALNQVSESSLVKSTQSSDLKDGSVGVTEKIASSSPTAANNPGHKSDDTSKNPDLGV